MTNHQPDTIDTKTPSSIPKSLQQRIDNLKDAEFQSVIAALINHYEPSSNLVHKKIKLTDFGSSIVKLEVSLLLPARKKAVLKVYDSAIKVEYKDGESICERSDILKVLVMKHSDKADSSYLCFIPSAMDKQFVSNAAIVCLIPSTQLRLFTMFDIESSSAALDCYYKAKQGCLYMFQNLLFFGFKKPVFVLQFEILKSIQVTCVTQRTFNIEILLESEEVIEFGMVEQKLYDSVVAPFVSKFSKLKAVDSNPNSEGEQENAEEEESEEDETFDDQNSQSIESNSGSDSDEGSQDVDNSEDESDGDSQASISIATNSDTEQQGSESKIPLDTTQSNETNEIDELE